MKKLFLGVVGVAGVTLAPDPGWGATTNLVLRTRTIVWQAGISTQLVSQLNQAAIEGKPVPAFVKFTNALSLTNHQLLQTFGVRLEDYLRDDSYSALLPSQTFLTNTPVLALVFAAEHWVPGDKLQVGTSTNQLPSWAYDPESNRMNLLVGFWRSVDRNTITNDLSSLGLSGIRYGADNSWAVVVPVQPLTNFAQILTNLALLHSVKFIQPGPLPFLPLNNRGRASTHTDDAQVFSAAAGTPNYSGASGDGVRIAICDDGINEAHNDFSPSRFYRSAPPGTPIKKHATHVASVALGNGYDSKDDIAGTYTEPFRYRGHAPQARIGNYDTNFGALGMVGGLAGAVGGFADGFYTILHTDGADVSNHSYVQSFTVYDSRAASLDIIVRGTGTDSGGNLIPARPSVWGAGNNGFMAKPEYDNEEGYYSVFTSAKNTISVGSVDTKFTPNERLSLYSSLGPTFDSRVKPDIVAPGSRNSLDTDEIMAANASGTGYRAMSGTSVSAPSVTGIIALMMHQYRKSFGIFPNSFDPPKVRPATYKALLIHTARDLVKNAPWLPANTQDWLNPDTGTAVLYYEGPDFATGYGLVNAEGAREKIAESAHWGEGVIPAKGSSQTWCIDVPAGAREIKVVLAWDDEPGDGGGTTPEVATRLVNDLDLVLKDPNGHIHLPWSLAGLPVTSNPGDGNPDPITSPPPPPTPLPVTSVRPAFKAPDHTNNVEMVTVAGTAAAPLAAGIWQAIITGFELPLGNIQRYGLVSSHPMSQLCASEIHWAPQRKDPPNFEKDICKIFPKVCNPDFICIPRLRVVGRYSRKGYLRFPVNCPVPIQEICKYVVHCPGCGDGPGWQLCPGFGMSVQGLPKYADLIIFNDQGEILARDFSTQKTRELNVPEQPPGGRQFVLVLFKGGDIRTNDLKLKFDFGQVGGLKPLRSKTN